MPFGERDSPAQRGTNLTQVCNLKEKIMRVKCACGKMRQMSNWEEWGLTVACIVICLVGLALSGCAHIKEHPVAYIVSGAIVAVVISKGGRAVDPCGNVPPYKHRQLSVCRRHFPR